MHVDNNSSDNNGYIQTQKQLIFKTADELGGSIFICDSNNKIEISDIQGNKFLSLVQFLKPYIQKSESWTQDIINKAEKLIIHHNKNNIDKQAEYEFTTDENGWTISKFDNNNRPVEFLNDDGIVKKLSYSTNADYSEYITEQLFDKDNNPVMSEYNGNSYVSLKYGKDYVVGKTSDSASLLLSKQEKDGTIYYQYDSENHLVNITKKDEQGNVVPIDKNELTREEQYILLSANLGSSNTYAEGRGGEIVLSRASIKNLVNSGYVDSHGNVADGNNNIQEAGTYIPNEQDTANMKVVFGETEFADNFSDHNQMLDAIEQAKKEGVDISDVTTLISCDTHSDVYLNMPTQESIADWVNALLAKNPNITDFYWVVSENMINDEEYGKIISGEQVQDEDIKSGTPFCQNSGTITNLNEEESIKTYYIGSDGYLCKEQLEPDMRPVRIHITTEKNLPNFSGQKVITTFDMDYFSNSGVDTYTFYRDNKNPEELNEAFSGMLRTFAEHNIRPVIHGNCYSEDDYLPKEDLKQTQEFAEAIIRSTTQETDLLNKYKHSHTR